jgi:hypothetical protein
MTSEFRYACIQSWVVAPTVVYAGFGIVGGGSESITVQPEDVGAWVDECRAKLGGLFGSIFGRPVWLEYKDGRIVSLWDPNRTASVAIPSPRKSPEEPAPGQVDDALAHVNRTRNGIQAPLVRGEDGWTSRSWPGEVWSARDVVAEARRLGWHP